MEIRKPFLPPNRSERDAEWRKSFVRSATVNVLSRIRKVEAREVELELRAPTTPIKVGDFPGSSVIRLMLLAQGSLAAAIFPLANVFDLKGIASFNGFPLASNVAASQWLLEGQPISVRQEAFVPLPLGQVKKLGAIGGISPELEAASGDNASVAIEYLIRTTIGKGLDQKLVSSDAETPEAPAGLLLAATPITGSDSMSKDLSALVAAISSSGINTASVAFAASPAQAMSIMLTAGPHFNSRIVASNMVPNGTILAIACDGLLVAGDGTDARIDVSKQTTLHMANPAAPISTVGTPNVTAAPTSSMLQQDLWAIRAIMMINWAVAPGAVSVCTGSSW